MNAVRRPFFVLFLVLTVNILLAAQQRLAPPPPPQTPRQALIEILNGSEKSLMKHLTIEVQQLLSDAKYKQGMIPLGMFGALRSQPGVEVETFDTGPVLLSVNSPKEHQKFEVNVNTDDLRGDQDTLEISFHVFHDGEEQEPEWQPFLTHFAVTLVRQKEIWRLSKIGVGAEFPIGDPEFLKKTVFKGAEKDVSGVGVVVPDGHTDSTPNNAPPEPVDIPAEQVVMMLGFAEASYARQHPDVGFTCSLADLAESSRQFGQAQPVTKGYRLNLTGCQGRPAGSFQITAEPMATGGKAYCTDATHNLRVSDDGRGSTCLIAGRSARPFPVEEEEVVSPGSDAPPDKPPEQ